MAADWEGTGLAIGDEWFDDRDCNSGDSADTSASGKVVFKPSRRGECYLLPPSLEELIGQDNLARFIDAVVDRLDLSELLAKYRGGGASAYHPATLLKIWLFGWCRKIYTSRPLAAALRRDVEFMWLAGEQRPSFMTLADFRRRLNTTIKKIFKDVAGLALQAGFLRGKQPYIDHTKMVANNNRQRAVWRKNAERYLEPANTELEKPLVLIDELNEEEEATATW
jgi:transposase